MATSGSIRLCGTSGAREVVEVFCGDMSVSSLEAWVGHREPRLVPVAGGRPREASGCLHKVSVRLHEGRWGRETLPGRQRRLHGGPQDVHQ